MKMIPQRQIIGCVFLIFNAILSFYILLVVKDYCIEIFEWITENKTYSFEKLVENQYCTKLNFLEASDSFRLSDGLEPVTLATHATSDILSTIENLPKMWDGPVSIAIFVDLKSQDSLEYLADLHSCDKEFSQKVTVHFAFRKSPFQMKCPKLKVTRSWLSCENFMQNRQEIRSRISGFFGLYPFGLMRNLARKGAKSDLHFVMDGDMIVNTGMAQKIKQIANELLNGKEKIVLLVRRFENTEGTTIPRNLEDLEGSMEKNNTFQFHHRYYFKGHKIPNLPYWFKISQGGRAISLSEVQYPNPNWEPQPILHRNDPLGPEYVPSRIKTMSSVIYKLCRAGYSFHVLSHVFNVQEGIKLGNTIYSQAISAHQYTYASNRSQERFTKEMDRLYPDTLDKCGHFLF